MGLKLQTSGRRMTRGSGTSQKDSAAFARTEPALSAYGDETRPLLIVREKNRRMLAEKYIFENPVESREQYPCPYPEMEKEYRISAISAHPDVLHSYAAPRSKCTKWNVKRLANELREGNGNERTAAAQELAMIASDSEIYFRETSIAALKALVMESLAHGTREAKEALESLGLHLERLPRTELIALTASRIRVWFSGKLSDALCSLGKRLEQSWY